MNNDDWLKTQHLIEKYQTDYIMNTKTIINVLREMLSNLCMGCSGCRTRCLDYQVLEYLLKEKEGDLSGK